MAEFLVGLARKVKLGTLSQELATQIQEAFERHMPKDTSGESRWVSSHSEAAGQLASRSPLILRALDAIHLAVAVEHKATMATLDGRLSEAARAMGVKILPQNPGTEEPSGWSSCQAEVGEALGLSSVY